MGTQRVIRRRRDDAIMNFPLRSRGFSAPDAIEFKMYWNKKIWTDSHFMTIYVMQNEFQVYLNEYGEQNRKVFFCQKDVNAATLISDINGVIEALNKLFSINFKFI